MNKTKLVKYDVIVVGGGLVGCAFALDLALKQPKFKIAIIDKNGPDNAFISGGTQLDSRIYAISKPNIDYLQQLKVWDTSLRFGIIDVMKVFGDDTGEINLDRRQAQQLFLSKTVECRELQYRLWQQITGQFNIDILQTVVSQINIKKEGDPVRVTDTSGHEYVTSLLVGADGARSIVRDFCKIPLSEVDYHQNGVVANFKCELSHNNTAYQWFLTDGSILAYLPLWDKHISIVLACADSQSVLQMSVSELETHVASIGGDKLGKLTLITSPAAFPLKMQHPKTTYARNIVLIGDAAHTLHPLAGQGVNLGFGDARLLSSILANVDNYQLGDSVLLKKYDNLRAPVVYQMQQVCHLLHKLFNSHNIALRHLRNRGLNLFNSINLLKKYLINTATRF